MGKELVSLVAVYKTFFKINQIIRNENLNIPFTHVAIESLDHFRLFYFTFTSMDSFPQTVPVLVKQMASRFPGLAPNGAGAPVTGMVSHPPPGLWWKHKKKFTHAKIIKFVNLAKYGTFSLTETFFMLWDNELRWLCRCRHAEL